MEIKAELLKPYTEIQKNNFIVVQNHQNGFEIRETESALEAWGFTEAEKEEHREEEINNLNMTPLDFIKVLESMGLTLEQINAFLEDNLNIKMQLTYCNKVYCGVAKQFLPLEISGIEITPEMIEKAFIAKEV